MGELTLTQLAADPFVQTGVLAVAGALITRILLRHYPARRLVFQLAFFLALTALLFHHDIVPYEIAPDPPQSGGKPSFRASNLRRAGPRALRRRGVAGQENCRH